MRLKFLLIFLTTTLLSAECIPLNTIEGSLRLQRSLHMPYNYLSHCYEEQLKNLCGVASSVIVLNALGHTINGTPVNQKNFFTQAVAAIIPESLVSQRGLQFEELLECLNTYSDLAVANIYGNRFHSSVDMVQALKQFMLSNKTYVIANFHRRSLDQKGGGHYSPLAAYDAVSNSILVLDVNPLYGPFWVDTETL